MFSYVKQSRFIIKNVSAIYLNRNKFEIFTKHSFLSCLFERNEIIKPKSLVSEKIETVAVPRCNRSSIGFLSLTNNQLSHMR